MILSIKPRGNNDKACAINALHQTRITVFPRYFESTTKIIRTHLRPRCSLESLTQQFSILLVLPQKGARLSLKIDTSTIWYGASIPGLMGFDAVCTRPFDYSHDVALIRNTPLYSFTTSSKFCNDLATQSSSLEKM
ncbi:hypothetical protein Hypma_016554 [Hypsizygus marmoreus]|uniref:Uncharacterized protein n=1 Tax=Hypsizygus marmoreus TaxID=39966 RepID=A0A369IY19_HYPMA|nr:hypothetical protein Hypma_016554 [Hypsizygus marmoreus]